MDAGYRAYRALFLVELDNLIEVEISDSIAIRDHEKGIACRDIFAAPEDPFSRQRFQTRINKRYAEVVHFPSVIKVVSGFMGFGLERKVAGVGFLVEEEVLYVVCFITKG